EQLCLILRRALQPVTNGHLEYDEGDEAEQCACNVDQPEGRGRKARIKPANPADHCIGDEEGEIIKADDSRAELPWRDLREECEADRKHMGEADAVRHFEHQWPEHAD